MRGTEQGRGMRLERLVMLVVDVSGMFIIMCLLQREAEIEKKGQYNQPYGNTISHMAIQSASNG